MCLEHHENPIKEMLTKQQTGNAGGYGWISVKAIGSIGEKTDMAPKALHEAIWKFVIYTLWASAPLPPHRSAAVSNGSLGILQ